MLARYIPLAYYYSFYVGTQYDQSDQSSPIAYDLIIIVPDSLSNAKGQISPLHTAPHFPSRLRLPQHHLGAALGPRRPQCIVGALPQQHPSLLAAV